MSGRRNEMVGRWKRHTIRKNQMMFMKALAVVIGGLVLFASFASRRAAASPVSRWEQSGPPNAAVQSMAVAQDGSDALYVMASDSVTTQSAAFRSDDAGATWTLLATALPGDRASAIAVDPKDSRRVFATTVPREGGFPTFPTRLYVSVDSGVTWRFAGDFPEACGGAFAFDTVGPAIYLNLGCSGELLASEDAGLTWQSRNSSLNFLRSGPRGVLYALRDGRIVFSVNGGYSWTNRNSPPCPYGTFIKALAVDSLGRLLASTGRVRMIFVDCPGLFRSNDGGFTWTRLSPGFSNAFVVDGSEPSRIYATFSSFPFAGEDVFVSVDNGLNWRALNVPSPAYGLALSPSGRLLYAATDEGLFRFSIRKTRVVSPR